ncbi:hypothetical protein DIE09_06420 [Burkholderia sp. Bp9010]|nr:hypothetical protein DIE10_06240 [Burkholderia sp. Bp9011]RQR97028.1 hypothetical protein DIE09_06420 [Burkholderia sp. Bp9010]
MASKTQEYCLEKHGYVDKLVFAFSHYDSSKYDPSQVAVREHEFEVEVPDDFDPRAGLVENLEREKRKITAEFRAKVTQINGQIQSLLAIEASPNEATP